MSNLKALIAISLSLGSLSSHLFTEDLQNAFAHENTNPHNLFHEDLEEVKPVNQKTKAIHKFVQNSSFSTFTGRIKGKKVRLRAGADLDSQVVKELQKNELITIIGEKGDFWAVKPDPESKLFVSRRFLIDNQVEGNKVNVRLQPSTEAAVVGYLNTGDKIEGQVSLINSKWMEISPPEHSYFYISKDFVENVGGPDYKVKHDQRKALVEKLFEQAQTFAKTEFSKDYETLNVDEIYKKYQLIVDTYADFPQYAEKAKECLISAQETTLQKKLAYIESKKQAEINAVKEKLAAKEKALTEKYKQILTQVTDKMKIWEPVEAALYTTWCNINQDQNIQDYYENQKDHAIVLTGIVEPYDSSIKNKPGDFIIKDKDTPIGYIYSTKINLQELVGKKITATVTNRPNNNFAFPAYYVLDVQP
ncbi:MAG: SH3 domain-containing protein [Rhabdochlamydiaceae bacterium]